MAIIMAIIGAATAAFFAFRHFVDAADQGREAIGDVKGVIRRGKWSRRIDKRLIENLADPREAGAILLYQIAAYDGAVTDAQKSSILSEMRTSFDTDEETAEGLFAFARMAVGEINDAGNSVRKILSSVQNVCTDEEKTVLIKMLETVAAVEGAPSDMQLRLINEVKRHLMPE